jgi:hypothetical protein
MFTSFAYVYFYKNLDEVYKWAMLICLKGVQEVLFPPITGTLSSISDGTCVGSEEIVEEIPYLLQSQ